MKRPATFTEANGWVHLPPEWFTRHIPSIRSVWQAEGWKVWVGIRNCRPAQKWRTIE